jgi:hypothetical protein
MKILQAYRMTEIPLEDFKRCVAEAATKSNADVLLFEYDTEETVDELTQEFDDPAQQEFGQGFVAEPLFGRTLLIPEGVMKREEILHVGELIATHFVPGGIVLQLGALEGVFAAAVSEMSTVYVMTDYDEVTQHIFVKNTEDTRSSVKVVDNAPGNVLIPGTDPIQPDGLLIVDNQDDEVWEHLVRHLKPSLPTPIILHDSCTLPRYLDKENIFFEQTTSKHGWFALQVTPTYVSEPDSENA